MGYDKVNPRLIINDPEDEKPKVESSYETMKDLYEDVEAEVRRRQERVRVEDRSKRLTFLCDRELIKRLDAISAGKGPGFKTLALNKAVRALLDEYEKN